jgi:hypothetical protein
MWDCPCDSHRLCRTRIDYQHDSAGRVGRFERRGNRHVSRYGQFHRELKGPWYDDFPFDFFAQILNPNRIVDSYEWTFDLAPRQHISREELIQNAQDMQKQLQ